MIPNGVNTETFYPRKLTEENFILFPNALREPVRKGSYFLLPTLKEIVKKHKIKCIITGKKSKEGTKIEKNLPAEFEYRGLVKIKELSEEKRTAIENAVRIGVRKKREIAFKKAISETIFAEELIFKQLYLSNQIDILKEATE